MVRARRDRGPQFPSRQVSGPAYPLEEVTKLARLAAPGKKASVVQVQDRLGISEPQAEAFVRGTVARLTRDDYAHTVEIYYPDETVTADVYGISDKYGGWYVKFHIAHGRVQVISCHEPDHPLQCTGGKIVT